MNVQLLGCVETHTPDRRAIRVPGGAGLLLAVLAWTPGRFVPDEVAIDRVWQERAEPKNPRDSLYIVATRLRKALGSWGEHVIRRGGGYFLEVGEERVDVARFRALVRRAEESARLGSDERATFLYDEALALWRGEPLSDVRTGWADTVRVALRHEYREALAGALQVALRSGRAADHVPALYRCVAEDPFDERLTGLLMLALAHGGCQSEALGLYRQLRDRIVNALGCEPGAELRRLHERLLCGEEAARDLAYASVPAK
ncbi:MULTISPECIES: BTAD domain-containing putative transcriptional regulator [unclassified Streptomyces]|uniref:AfsR/SARP family transcriptional regulator n=1 Tax=unclassified Streptomyces TaxID=2593676 RepID=UPI0036EC4241